MKLKAKSSGALAGLLLCFSLAGCAAPANQASTGRADSSSEAAGTERAAADKTDNLEGTSSEKVSRTLDFSNILFEQGEPNPVSDRFTGDTYLASLLPSDDVFRMPTTFHVTFEPCARTDWHSHDGGQILIVTSGMGYHQAEGQTAEIIRTGYVILAEPGVKHWHGAGEEGVFSHIVISTNPDHSGVNWMEPVTDEEYEGLEAVEFADRAVGISNQQAAEDLGAGASFAIGEPNPFSEYFTGNTYLSSLVSYDEVFHCPTFSNVTFEPCARTDWHSHDGGQILLVTGGRGYHQIEGQPVEEMKAGDVILVEPGVKHWHGAAEDSWFSHMAVGTNPDNAGVNWMEPVTDEAYFGGEAAGE